MKRLVLLTHWYPYGIAESFLENELNFISEAFSEVVILPMQCTGKQRPTPDSVKVIDLFKEPTRSAPKALKHSYTLFSSPLTYRGFVMHPKALLKKADLKHLMQYNYVAFTLYKKLKAFLKEHPQYGDALFYSYWFHVHTTAIALLKEKHAPNITLITRAHGSDLFEEDYSPPFIPFRTMTLKQVDTLFSISEKGRHYLSTKYPAFRDRFHLSRLGVHQPDFTTKQSDEGAFSIVSCAYLKSLKRIDLLIEGIRAFASNYPDVCVRWDHLGGGEFQSYYDDYAHKRLPSNVTWSIHGHVDNDKIYDFYRSHTIDVMLSTSRTEGVPVSMMEAQACGIPIIATAVGGVPEIVNLDNGILLPPTPTAKEIAEALVTLHQDRTLLSKKKTLSQENFAKNYCADTNYTAFVNTIR